MKQGPLGEDKLSRPKVKGDIKDAEVNYALSEEKLRLQVALQGPDGSTRRRVLTLTRSPNTKNPSLPSKS
jgi:hypothetical protein